MEQKAIVLIHIQPQAIADDSSLHKFTKKLDEFMDEKSILHF